MRALRPPFSLPSASVFVWLEFVCSASAFLAVGAQSLTGVRSALSRAGFRPRVPRMNRLVPGCGLVQLRVLRRCLRLARFSWLCVRGVNGVGARLFDLRALLGPARQGFRAWNRAGLRAVRMGRAPFAPHGAGPLPLFPVGAPFCSSSAFLRSTQPWADPRAATRERRYEVLL